MNWRKDCAPITARQRPAARQTLNDGTLLTLNTDSAADVRFDDRLRLVRLRYGEIAVTTARDRRQRPFRVQTRDGLLTALGTEFTLRQFPRDTRLTVQQHAVEAVLSGGQRKIVHAGESLWFTHDAFPPSAAEWQRRKLDAGRPQFPRSSPA